MRPMECAVRAVSSAICAHQRTRRGRFHLARGKRGAFRSLAGVTRVFTWGGAPKLAEIAAEIGWGTQKKDDDGDEDDLRHHLGALPAERSGPPESLLHASHHCEKGGPLARERYIYTYTRRAIMEEDRDEL